MYFLRAFYKEGRISQLKNLLENLAALAPWFKLQSNPVALSKRVEVPFDPFGLLIHKCRLGRGDLNYQKLKFGIENALEAARGGEVRDFRKYVSDSDCSRKEVVGMLFGSAYNSGYSGYANKDPRKVRANAEVISAHLTTTCGGVLGREAVPMLEGLLLNFPRAKGRVAAMFQAGGETGADSLLKVQFITDLFTTAFLNEGCYFWKILTSPDVLTGDMVVTMPANEMKMIAAAKIRDVTRWYTCENGHPFSIGNCGMAMQKAKCTCGAPIGGTDHRLEHGKNADINALANDDEPGYNKEFVQSTSCEDIMRDSLDPFGVRVLRCIVHGVLSLSCALGNSEKVQKLIGYTSPDQCADHCVEMFEKDWEACKKSAGLNNEQFGVFLSNVLDLARSSSSMMKSMSSHRTLKTPSDREAFERAFGKDCIKPLVRGERVKQNIDIFQAKVAEFCPLDQKSVVMNMVGQEIFNEIAHHRPTGYLTLERQLLRYTTPITYDGFIRAYKMNPDNKERCPTLSIIFDHVEDLAVCKYFPSVLAWHGILFEALRDGISREDASKLTNGAAIEMLPQRRQDEAKRIFEEFAEGFNLCMPKVKTILECETNKFTIWKDEKTGKTFDHRIDMGLDQSVTFSLPNERAHVGCCTMRLLEMFTKAHNNVIEKYAETMQEDTIFHASKNKEMPFVDLRTPIATLRNRIIDFSQETHLLPLILTFNTQSLEYEHGEEVSYDVERVEQVLTNQLLKDKSPINIAVRRFEYRGEAQETALLDGLVVALGGTSEDLSEEVKQTIIAELDTQYRTRQLLNFLEGAIEFIIAVSKGHSKGHKDTNLGSTPLQQYATDVMMVAPEKWDQLASPTLSESVCLCHLQNLFLMLEEELTGSFLDKIRPRYKQPLTTAQREDLLVAQLKFDVPTIVIGLRSLLRKTCLGDTGPDPDTVLRDYLDYAEVDDTSFDEMEDYDENFPRSCLFKNALAVYQLLTGASVDRVEKAASCSGGGAAERFDGFDGDSVPAKSKAQIATEMMQMTQHLPGSNVRSYSTMVAAPDAAYTYA
jgi:hypothetical protein